MRETEIEFLAVVPNSSVNEAREHSDITLVYLCPKCLVGHKLINVTMDIIKCNLCGKEYKKP